MIISLEEKRNTAYHEAGHALVAKLLPGADPGPQGDDHPARHGARPDAAGPARRPAHVLAGLPPRTSLAILFGGRAAEELVLGQMTTGAGNDIERATELARKMVCEWGMSEKLGPMTFGKKEEEIFLGRDFTQRVDYSETTAVQIDAEVRRIVWRRTSARSCSSAGTSRCSTRWPRRCSSARPSTAPRSTRSSAQLREPERWPPGRGGRHGLRPALPPGRSGVPVAPHPLRRPRARPVAVVVGVLNATPDSFSDGGRPPRPRRAAAAAAAHGGGGRRRCSTSAPSRPGPGAAPVPRRRGARAGSCRCCARSARRSGCRSPSTPRKAAVARAALDAGADLVNDVTAGRVDPAMLALCAAADVPIVLMHMQGTPATMQRGPAYTDVVAEVARLPRRARAPRPGRRHRARRDRRSIPGIGFGKTVAHNLRAARRLDALARARLSRAGGRVAQGVHRRAARRPADGRAPASARRRRWRSPSAGGARLVRVHDVGADARRRRAWRRRSPGAHEGAAHGLPLAGRRSTSSCSRSSSTRAST